MRSSIRITKITETIKLNPMKNPSSNPGGNNSKLGVLEWRVKFKINTATVDINKCDWCKLHKTEGLCEVMYMPHPHNHEKWRQKRN